MMESVVCTHVQSLYACDQCRPDPDCCDGSDEPLGVCKNLCKEIGEAYRKKRDAERKMQKTVRIF
jgi:hypothetical protein